MHENIKLVVADIDGTIAVTSKDPSKYTIDIINKIKRNYLFGLASGRPAEDIKNKYIEWGINSQFDFIIGWNGVDLFDNKTNIKYQYNLLKKEWIKEIIEFMSEFDIAIHMYLPNIYLSSTESDRAWFSAFKSSRKFVLANDYKDFYKVDNGGIMFRCKIEQMDKIHNKLKTLKDKDYVGFNTQNDLIEFSNKNANKGNALRNYCGLYNINLKDCLSFGDNSNDDEMLKISTGICMLDGNENTKKCATYITEKTCLDDGFASYLERYLL